MLAMIHDFRRTTTDTPTVIRKELKIEPEEFDKQFLAYDRNRRPRIRGGAFRRMERRHEERLIELTQKKD